ncbi:AMP-binding protein [Streptomyces sp. NPDC127091]|uniref:AMP-binding protein n=1 Tax=Streptomyces sp. NPDC127091 TaxID=3347134 RepID=UPI003665B029
MFFKHASLRGLPHHQVRSRPDDIEVTAAGGDLTFHELKAGADRLGSHLAALGPAPDTCVGLYDEPSADLVTGVWGILTAGAAYQPLSPDYPEARLRYMVENAGVRIVVTQPHPADRLESLVPRGTIVVTAADAPETGNPLRPDGPQAHHLAYVIHTSGSTGKPKGVMIEQRSIVSQPRRLADCGHLGPDVSILQKTPMSFDAAQWEILACAVGARVVMGAPGLFRNPEGILKPLGEEVVERRHVIAIDQGVYDRSAIGISAVSRAGEEQRHHVVLGTLLHHLQRTGHMGFMSSGSSSKTGNPLPAPGRPARRSGHPRGSRVVLLRRRPHHPRTGRTRGHGRGRRAHQRPGRDDPRRPRTVPARLHDPGPRGGERTAAHRQRQDRRQGHRTAAGGGRDRHLGRPHRPGDPDRAGAGGRGAGC